MSLDRLGTGNAPAPFESFPDIACVAFMRRLRGGVLAQITSLPKQEVAHVASAYRAIFPGDQASIAFGLARPALHRKSARMIVPALLMIWTGLYGQFGETGDFARLNLWGVISSIFFVWMLIEVRGVITAGVASSPAELKPWPKNIWWYFLATWGIYPIAYALPQLGANGDIVVVRQLLFTIADVSTKLIYGIILSRYVLRRSALEGYVPAAEALETMPVGAAVASKRGD